MRHASVLEMTDPRDRVYSVLVNRYEDAYVNSNEQENRAEVVHVRDIRDIRRKRGEREREREREGEGGREVRGATAK